MLQSVHKADNKTLQYQTEHHEANDALTVFRVRHYIQESARNLTQAEQKPSRTLNKHAHLTKPLLQN